MLHAKSVCLAFCAQALQGYILNARYIYMVYPSKNHCDANPPIRNWPFSYFNYLFRNRIFIPSYFHLQFANMVLKLLSDIGLGCIIGEVILLVMFYLYVYICTDVQIFIGIYIHSNVPTCTCKINVYDSIFII